MENPPYKDFVDPSWQYVPEMDGTLTLVNVDELAINDISALAEFSPEENVKFELYTANNPTEPQILDLLNLTAIRSSNFDPEIPVRIFIHGWLSLGGAGNVIRDAYFQLGNHSVNYIAVTWNAWKTYWTARENVNIVGPYVADFIDTLVKDLQVPLKSINLIGHSLGAHIAGIGECHIQYLFHTKH